MWLLGLVVLLVLMIPLTAVVLDSEVGHALARRLGSSERAAEEERLRALEDEVRYLSETVASLQEETQFIRRLLENPEPKETHPPGEA